MLDPVIACPGVDIPSRANSSYSPEYIHELKRKLGISDNGKQKENHNSGRTLTKKKD